jgi:hypothetical protein
LYLQEIAMGKRLSRAPRPRPRSWLFVVYDWQPSTTERNYHRARHLFERTLNGRMVDFQVNPDGSMSEGWQVYGSTGQTETELRRVLASRGITRGIHYGTGVVGNAGAGGGKPKVVSAGREREHYYRANRAFFESQHERVAGGMRREAKEVLASGILTDHEGEAFRHCYHESRIFFRGKGIPSVQERELMRLMRLARKLRAMAQEGRIHESMADVASAVLRKLSHRGKCMLKLIAARK